VTSELDHYRPAEMVAGTGIHGLQARYRELGRLRMGQRVDTGRVKNGRKVTRPEKLETWRLTSTDWRLIAKAAELYGGEPSRWEEAPGWNTEKQTGVRQYQVTTEANDVPVMLPPEIALSQAMEAWTAGQCLRRCDGDYDVISGAECLCRDETLDGGTQACKPTTRLSVLLTEMPGLGVWRLETHGWYAASELVPMVRMAATFGSGQGFRLRIDPRQRQTKGSNGKLVTYHFGVPVLDTDLTPGQLLAATPAPPPVVEVARMVDGQVEQMSGAEAASSASAGGRFPSPLSTSAPDPMSPPAVGGGLVPPAAGPGGGDPTSAAVTHQGDEPAAATTTQGGDATSEATDNQGAGPEEQRGVSSTANPAAPSAPAGPTPPIQGPSVDNTNTEPGSIVRWASEHGLVHSRVLAHLRREHPDDFGDLKSVQDLWALGGESSQRAIAYLEAAELAKGRGE
jgi:hypothetical protein